MAESSVSVVASFSAVGPLVAGWIAAAVLYASGVTQRNPVRTGMGLFLAGILAFVSVALVEIVALPAGPRGYDVSLGDLLALGLAGFLGGALAMLGLAYVILGGRRARTPSP